jgi:3'(2'), 5'-bisphosphate nucleotidase
VVEVSVTEKELDIAKKLAIEAGAILLNYYKEGFSVDWKAPDDPVTAADRDASHLIVSSLKHEFPEHGILCEEEPDDLVRLERPYVWMIDPMDGTREFIAHRDEFAVQIGLVFQGTPILGVVYQPTNNKLYYAAQGFGAFLDIDNSVTPLHVSVETVASRLKIAESRSHRSARVDAIRQGLRIPESILMGSVGLKIGLVCESRAHLYVHTGHRTHLWDTCGPEAILREAGGRMTDVSNTPLRYDTAEVKNLHGIIATNAAIHDRVVNVTRSVLESFSRT